MSTTVNGILIGDAGSSTLAGSTTTPAANGALTITRLGAYVTGDAVPADEVTAAEVIAYDKATA